MSLIPKYPIYVPSKGRADTCYTARFLVNDGVPFRLVVEPQEREAYERIYGKERVLTLPWNNPGSVIPARNWIKAHSIKEGHARHWQLDDNIKYVMRRYKAKRLLCNSGIALRVAEDFTDRYSNIGLAGLQYVMFMREGMKCPPFFVNCHVYSCSLVDNSQPFKWRGKYNEDTDYCLQVIAAGLCTLTINAFCVHKLGTMRIKGGNTATLYKGDGRLRMARALERLWPGVVTVNRRFKRPQHVVKFAWQRFTTPLKLKPGIRLPKGTNEYGMKLVATKEIRSENIKELTGLK